MIKEIRISVYLKNDTYVDPDLLILIPSISLVQKKMQKMAYDAATPSPTTTHLTKGEYPLSRSRASSASKFARSLGCTSTAGLGSKPKSLFA